MLVSYKVNGEKVLQEFSYISVRLDSKKTIFKPEMCSLIGETSSGVIVTLLYNLQKKKADKIYKRIQRQLNNPMWMGGVINV